MKLFEVTRFGNDIEGPNGSDTNYLVLANDHEEAASLVRPLQSKLDAIAELGVCSAEVAKSVIFRGPYLEPAIERGTFFTLWSWDPRGLDAWVPTPSCLTGHATCHYANGQLAACCSWHEGRKHGSSEGWYSNGQLMYRRAFKRGKYIGVHECFYSDGSIANRHTYTAEGVQFQKWNRSGELVADGAENWHRRGK